ncbi:BPSS1780 family membrane protein [Ferriphaselus sp. R-1]|uniref:BPSS1780 family membrane protein n=1 Tax=Ferriphaselus sp. R-1 TaxID=1485544 RepID=UPI0005551F77|nr:BPSS1780 family membrane protein [Ferriphaselus sp. R-1]
MEARKVTALHGWQWIRQGWTLFQKSPVLWVVLVVIGLTGLIALSAVPTVGEPLATLLFPALLAGYMQGCRALDRGEELELAHLFAGFRHHSQQLVTLGGINYVGQLLIFGVMTLAGGATLVGLFMSGKPIDDPALVAQAVAGAGFAILLGFTLFTALLMAGQFAPMLVTFDQAAAIPALKASLKACLDNIVPMSVYCLMLLPFALAASLPAMLGWLVLLPVLFTSLYAAYRDLFASSQNP